MNWREDDLEPEGHLAGADKAFTLLHEAPAVPTARQQKSKKDQAPNAEELALKQLLEAHPALYAGEPEEYRMRRADAMQACWQDLSARIQRTLEGTDLHVFQQLLTFAQGRHRTPQQTAALSRDGYHRVPTALMLAGGVNSADHAQTFPNLVAHLRGQGAYVALLQPHSFGRSVGDALNAVLRQFSGLDTQAEHVEALIAWYRDQVGEAGADADNAPIGSSEAGPSSGATAAAAAAAGPAAATREGEQQQEQEEQEPGDASAGKRQLRGWGPATGAGGGSGRGAAAEAQCANWGRLLVIVVEGTESLEPAVLSDVLLTLSESYAQLPVSVLLGLTTAESALHEMLSSEVTDRCMDCVRFTLAGAMARLNRVVSEVLLGGSGAWPGLLFDAGIVSSLVDRFFLHYYSTGIFRQGLQLAALDHFRSQPASFLATAALEGPEALREACAKLPSPVAAELKRRVEGRGGARTADAILEAMDAWRRWAVGLHWIVTAASFAGAKAKLQYFSVLQDGLAARFSSTGTAGQLPDLERRLRVLQPQQVCQLVGQLEAAACKVEGAELALRKELQQLQEIAHEALQPPEQQQQQQGECSGAAEAAAAAEAAGGPPAGEGGSEEASAGPAAGAAAKQGPKKRERYYTKASRLEALMKKSAAAGAAKKGAAAAAAERRAKEEAAPGAKLAAWLTRVLGSLLATPPTKLPGAAVFTCKGVGALDCLTGAPRQVSHAALTQPHLFLEGLPQQVGCDASMEDACLAYTLFDQDANCANVADWFQAFCDVHTEAEERERSKGKKAAGGRKGAATKKKKKGKGAADAEAGEDGGGAEEAQRARQRELAARFSQATAELQLVGFVKPAKRRRGDYVQRVAHMPAEADL